MPAHEVYAAMKPPRIGSASDSSTLPSVPRGGSARPPSHAENMPSRSAPVALRKMSLTSCVRSMNQLSCSHTEATHSANAGITRVQASFSQAPIIVGGDVGGVHRCPEDFAGGKTNRGENGPFLGHAFMRCERGQTEQAHLEISIEPV